MNTIRVSIERKLTVSKTKVLVRMLAGTKACLETELAGVLCSAVILQWSLISLTFSSSATNKSREETSHWSRSVEILCSDWYYVRQLSYAIREPAQGTLKAHYKGHFFMVYKGGFHARKWRWRQQYNDSNPNRLFHSFTFPLYCVFPFLRNVSLAWS